MYSQKPFNRIIGALLIISLSGLSFSGKTWAPSFLREAQAGFFNDDLGVFKDVLQLVSENYVYAPDYEKLFSSAIQSMSEIVDPRDASIKFSNPHRIQIQNKETTESDFWAGMATCQKKESYSHDTRCLPIWPAPGSGGEFQPFEFPVNVGWSGIIWSASGVSG